MTIASRHQDPGVQPSVRGLATGVIFLTIFGALWAAVGVQGLNGLVSWLGVILLVVGVVLLGAGISLSRASRRRRLSQGEMPTSKERQRRNKWFLIVFGTEILTIVIARMICWSINRLDLFVPVTMLIVGIHFFPLASLFRVRRYRLSGVLLCLLAISTVLVVPEQLRLVEILIDSRFVMLGIGGALIIWGIGLAQWLQGRKLLAQESHVA